MDNRYAVMDLGTNTFHLLIAEGNISNFKILVHEHIAVKLGEGGINKGIILPAPFERGIATLKEFAQEIKQYKVQHIKCIGTSALRNASNAGEFISQVKNDAGLSIEVIGGSREANYIYGGIKAADVLTEAYSLIMDIGGGSIEFIIGNKHSIVWRESFEIGAARLMDRFHHSDPIEQPSVEAIYTYLEHKLGNLFTAVERSPVQQLIGSSGSFETFAELAALRRNEIFDLASIKNYKFDYHDLQMVINELIRSTHDERAANAAIIPVRVDMIVVSSVVTRYIVAKLGINQIALCTYSLKEGILAEMMQIL